MRNLKKVLTLVLTVAMLLSIMVVGTGAAFSDQSSIKNTEAVDACSALNIIAGMEDGSYRPANNVTRAQMCKMICVALNGGKEPTLGTNNTPTFNDVRTDASSKWAESFIESCYTQGIVSGVGNGRFNPSGSVTGTQAARMLLVALGYRADQEGFTGTSWEINVNTIASAKGLYKGIEGVDANAALSRDNAAQMIWNALNAYEVEYVSQLVTENGALTSKLTVQDKVVGDNKDKITMMEDKYETESPTGILTSVTQEDGKSTFKLIVNVKSAQKEDTYQPGNVSFSKVSGDYSDLLGQDVKVLVKPEKNGQDAVVYGVYATSKNTVVTALADDMDDFNKGGDNRLTINGTTYKTATADAKKLPVVTSPDIGDVFNDAKTIKDLQDNFPYFNVKFVDNDDDDKLDLAIVTPFVPAQIDSISSSKITLSYLDVKTPDYGVLSLSSTSPNVDDVDLYSNAAEDDYVAVVDDAYTVNGKVSITKMDTVAGKIEATREGGSEFRSNGSWYTIVADESVNLNDEYDCAAVGSFVFAFDATASSVSASNILYVDEAAKSNNGVNKGMEATVYFADGSASTVRLTKYDGDKIYDSSKSSGKYGGDHYLTAVTESFLEGSMFKFTKKSDSEYEIKPLTQGSYDAMYPVAGRTLSGTLAKDGKFSGTDSTSTAVSFRIADEAVVFVTDGSGDTSVKTGKSVANWNSSATVTKAAALTDKSSGYQYAKIACVTISNDIPSSSDYLYGYVTSKVIDIDSDGSKYQFDIWNGTDTITLTTEDNDVTAKGQFIAYSMDGDLANIELTVKSVSDAVAIKGFDADSILFSGQVKEIDFADKYVVIGVDTENKEGISGTKLATAKETFKGSNKYWANAVYFVDGGEVAAVFVDTQGKMHDGTDFVPVDKTTVGSVTLTIPTAPAVGQTPASVTATASTGAKVNSIDFAGSITNEKFVAGTTTATIKVAPESSVYTLTGLTKTNITVPTGWTVTACSVTNDVATITATYTIS